MHIHLLRLLPLLLACSLGGCDPGPRYDHSSNHHSSNSHDYNQGGGDTDFSHGGEDSNNEFQEMVREYESQDRVIWQKPGKVIEMLGGLAGKTVADIGAGTGYFAFRMAQDAGKVVAIDVDPRFLIYMDSIAKKFPEGFTDRFETRLADFNDAKLKAGEVDAVTLVNTYCYIEDRVAYFNRLRGGIKPSGKLLVVDYKKRGLPEGQGPPEALRVSLDDVTEELTAAGYRILKIDTNTLEYQYIVLAISR